MNDLLKNAVEEAARETYQWWQNAVEDIGNQFEPPLSSKDAQKAYEHYLKTRTDKESVKEAMVDWFAGNTNTIVDYCGDYIYDCATIICHNPPKELHKKSHSEVFVMICKQCQNTHSGKDWENAMSRLIAYEKSRLAHLAKEDAAIAKAKAKKNQTTMERYALHSSKQIDKADLMGIALVLKTTRIVKDKAVKMEHCENKYPHIYHFLRIEKE